MATSTITIALMYSLRESRPGRFSWPRKRHKGLG